MIDISAFYSQTDRELVHTIAAHLQRGAEARVWLEALERDETIPDVWDKGLSSVGMIFLLAPDSVPARRGREPWEEVLGHLERGEDPPIASVLVRDCQYPPMLRRKNGFDFRGDLAEGLRALQRWAVSLHQQPQGPAFVPAPVARPVSSVQLDRLGELLIDRAGTAVLTGDVATDLAQEFASRAQPYFRDVVWVGCGDRDPVFISGELDDAVGGDARELIRNHRVLVILDDVTNSAPVTAPPEGPGAVLITTRRSDLEAPVHALRLDTGRFAALSEPKEPDPLWDAIRVCRPHAFPLELAAQIAGLDDPTAKELSSRLTEGGLICPLDRSGIYRRSREPQHEDATLRRRHAECLLGSFRSWRRNLAICKRYLPEFESAFSWAAESDWEVAVPLAQRVFDFLKSHGRTQESVRVLELLRGAAELHQDADTSEYCMWELSWLENRSVPMPSVPMQQLSLPF